MAPIAGRLGPFLVYSFSLAISLGIVTALGLTIWLDKGLDRRWLDGVLLAGAAGMVAGRIAFVALNTEYFAENPTEAWQVWLGGLDYHATLLTGLAAFWLWTRLAGRPFARDADRLAPGLALLVAFGWVACWLDGCAYGRETLPGPFAGALPDSFGVFAARYQTQVAGMLSAVVVLVVALWARGRLPPAIVSLLVMGLLAVAHAWIGLFRGDPAPAVLDVRVDVWLDGAIALAFLVALGALRLRRGPDSPDG